MIVEPAAPTSKNPPEQFTGDVWLDPVAGPREGDQRMTVALVRFAPGARTAWHSHARGQFLRVTQGVALVGTRDGSVVELHPGQTLYTLPGEEHWHGAGLDRWMEHLAMLEGADEPAATTVWLEHVTPEQYAAGRSTDGARGRAPWQHRAMHLRPYRASDAEPTWQVFHAAVHGTASADYTAEQLAAWAPDTVDLAGWGERRARAQTVVAVLGDRVVGFSDLTDDGVLDMLFVHPEAGGRGAARAMVTWVLDRAADRGTGQVMTHASRTARPAFERFGFRVERADPGNTARGVRVPNYLMVCEVPAPA